MRGWTRLCLLVVLTCSCGETLPLADPLVSSTRAGTGTGTGESEEAGSGHDGESTGEAPCDEPGELDPEQYPDSGGGYESGTQLEPAQGGLQHPECQLPSPDPLPGVPNLNVTPTGEPAFNQWAEIACQAIPEDEDLEYGELCGGVCNDSCEGFCIRSGPDARGVCTYGDVDIWCDGEGEAIGFAYDQCWICSPPEVHAKACCAGLEGFDCRIWPFPSDGPPGSVCARHNDCEDGLICGDAGGKGYGICMCPGVSGQDVQQPESCWSWGHID